ncbi:MAG: AAA family ATPase, partial [Eubacteriales bacterium]|nr:AAA family ATPase [Eubacteriales bacterium]
MRLKNIEMQGFKSFADKIYLDFNSGITAIVGPNGSGKSNISDAIRWVMGEQSVKSLRGSRMEDVIFAGTEKRKALGFAEVTLTLDNTDGYFSLDFPEITVTRRVYRSGDGEYYINKTLCRLKDIHELFMDTGLGRDGYSIIGQGKIDSILSTKSEDRRQIFEEAAGISKYKYRKLEAERKLVQTVDNLTRVKDILSELEGQLGPLERQSEKAKRYLILRDELRGIDIAVSIINIDRIKEESAKLSQDLELLNAQISEIAASLEETDSAISGMYSELTALDEQAEKINSDERDLLFKISESEKESGILRNDAEHNRDNIDRLKAEILNISESTKVIESDIKQHKSKLEELGRESVQNKSEIEEITALISAANIETSEKGGALESLKSRIMDITAKIGSLKVYIENSEILKDSFVRRKTDILSERSERAKSVDELTQKRDSAAADERNFNAELKKVIVERKKNEENIRQTRAEFEKLSVQRNNTILELGRRRSRRTMLIDMEREMEGYAKGVKGIMTAYKSGRFGNAKIYGPLAQLIKTDKKYITAIETALGAASQNIVTETENEAKQAIAYLKEKHLGRATFLPVSSIKTRNFDPS